MDLSGIATADLVAEMERRVKCAAKPEKRMIFIGPPGCGKGTQAPIIKKEYCICHLATGDMLRAFRDSGTPAGNEVKGFMDRGAFVPDATTIRVLKEALKAPECSKGFILDGFPRTVPQAEELDRILAAEGKNVDVAVNMAIDDTLLVDRISGRRIHKPSGRSYHVKFNPPKVDGIDDVTGEPLIQRPDDNATALVKRLEEFHQKTQPVIDYYAAKGKVVNVTANQEMKNVTSDIYNALDGKK
jgi:adenylate kinase